MNLSNIYLRQFAQIYHKAEYFVSSYHKEAYYLCTFLTKPIFRKEPVSEPPLFNAPRYALTTVLL